MEEPHTLEEEQGSLLFLFKLKSCELFTVVIGFIPARSQYLSSSSRLDAYPQMLPRCSSFVMGSKLRYQMIGSTRLLDTVGYGL